mgnify:CR=1 FL=1
MPGTDNIAQNDNIKIITLDSPFKRGEKMVEKVTVRRPNVGALRGTSLGSVMMMDVEKVLSETTKYDDEVVFRNIKPLNDPSLTVFFADDSIVARKQITRTLEAMNVKYVSSINGRDAWNELEKIAAYAEASGQEITDLVSLVLTDIEMPEMDGYILTKKIKTDPRFAGVPVIMHSSLSGMSNQQLGKSVGVDEYVPKFEAQKLSETLTRRLLGSVPVVKPAS